MALEAATPPLPAAVHCGGEQVLQRRRRARLGQHTVVGRRRREDECPASCFADLVGCRHENSGIDLGDRADKGRASDLVFETLSCDDQVS